MQNLFSTKSAVSACVGAWSIYQLWKLYKRRKRLAELESQGYIKLKLLPSERSPVICMSPATSTITFFSGSGDEVKSWLSKRVSEIVEKNPWLTAILEYDRAGELAAYYSMDKSKNLFSVQDELSLKDVAYDKMVSVLAPFLCKTSDEAVGACSSLFSVTLLLLPDEKKRFAVVVSANHSLVDGHDFYKLHNMLSVNATVKTMNPKRKQHIPAKIVDAMGGEKSLLAECPPGFLARFIYGQLRGFFFPQTEAIGFYLSNEWIAAQKNAAVQRGEVPFVSTNDCVVSAFSNCLQADIVMMAANFRGKVDGCNESDCGNYEDLIVYLRKDYASPTLLRKSVTAPLFRRAATPPTKPLTNLQHLLGATYGAATNWSTFAKPIFLGQNECRQELHLPLFDWPAACPASIFGSIVIFRPKEGKLAAMVAGKKKLINDIKASGLVGPLLGIKMKGD